jgi:RNA polymerase sigma-70 factor (ECF subfamily)
LNQVRPNGTTAHRDFDSLYERLHPQLCGYVERLVGDGDVAEDVAQEAFVRLLQRPELTGEDARLWIFTVATNLVRDRGRSTVRRRQLLSARPVHQGAAEPPNAGVERAEIVRTVRSALDRLPERDRVMLLMREEGFRYAEIARAVDVAPASVGTLIARAVKRFVEVYSPDE